MSNMATGNHHPPPQGILQTLEISVEAKNKQRRAFGRGSGLVLKFWFPAPVWE